MELWIRSQNKEKLVKAIDLEISDETKTTRVGTIFNAEFDFVIVNDWESIGRYETKKRALEVLDEIHDRIATLTTIDLMGVNDTNLKVFNKFLKEKYCSVVYQMPKE